MNGSSFDAFVRSGKHGLTKRSGSRSHSGVHKDPATPSDELHPFQKAPSLRTPVYEAKRSHARPKKFHNSALSNLLIARTMKSTLHSAVAGMEMMPWGRMKPPSTRLNPVWKNSHGKIAVASGA